MENRNYKETYNQNEILEISFQRKGNMWGTVSNLSEMCEWLTKSTKR